MTKREKLKRVETELRAYIEAGLEDGSLVLDELQYGFNLVSGGTGVVKPQLEEHSCSICLLGAAVRMAIGRGKSVYLRPLGPPMGGIGVGSHKALGAAALGIRNDEALALEYGFMGLAYGFVDDRGLIASRRSWYRLGSKLRRDYYSCWAEVGESGKPGRDDVPSVANVYRRELAAGSG